MAKNGWSGRSDLTGDIADHWSGLDVDKIHGETWSTSLLLQSKMIKSDMWQEGHYWWSKFYAGDEVGDGDSNVDGRNQRCWLTILKMMSMWIVVADRRYCWDVDDSIDVRVEHVDHGCRWYSMKLLSSQCFKKYIIFLSISFSSDFKSFPLLF